MMKWLRTESPWAVRAIEHGALPQAIPGKLQDPEMQDLVPFTEAWELPWSGV